MIRRHLERARATIDRFRRRDFPNSREPGFKTATRKVLLLKNNETLAVALEQALAPHGYLLEPIGDTLRDRLDESNEVAVVVAGITGETTMLDLIRGLGRQYPQVRIIVVAEPGTTQRLHLRVAEYFGARVLQYPFVREELFAALS